MKKRTRILAGVMSAAMVLGGFMSVPVTQVQAEAVVSELPGTVSVTKEYDPSFLSVTGFAKGSVNDRRQYIGTDKYRVANNEEEFLRALDDAKNGEVKVIELTADLDLGWDALSEQEQEYSCIAQYGWDIHGTDITNPSILESNVSQLTISNTNGLTIFSRGGNTVKHAEWKLQGTSSDIIIRNLTIDEMWHWSDAASNKEAGWTLMKLNGVKGVWIDHCSFTLGADGNVDSENGSENMTMSWNTYSLPATETPGKDSMMYKTVSYMEYLYQEGKADTDGRYYKLREAGATPGQIMAYEAHHDKLCLNGSGDKDFTDGYDSAGNNLKNGNQRLHLTLAYDKVYSIGQRFPLIRQGTAHLLNCYVDNSGHMALYNNNELPFKKYGGWALNRAINARDGASVGADNCVFKEMRVITGTEKHYVGYANMNEGWDVAFSEAYNHALVVNSRVELNGKTYEGSSWDNGGDNLFMESPSGFYNDGGSTIGNFHWFSSIDNVENYTREVAPYTLDENGNKVLIPFTFTYSQGDDNKLPYEYSKIPLDEVEDTVDKYAGSYVFNEGPEFWLRTEYDADYDVQPVDKSVKIAATDVKLSAESISLDVDTVRQLNADVIPSYASEQEVIWQSSDPEIAEVLDSGLVIGRSGGTVTVTATTKDGTNIVKECAVTVNVGVSSISLNAPKTTVYVGETMQLSAEILPENATDKSVTWSSSNSKVLKVDENGVVTGVKAGKNTTITCKSVSNPEVTAKVTITVKEGTAPAPELLYGDANGDGLVNATDALAVLRTVVGLDTLEGELYTQADVDGTAGISANDALVILRYVVGLINVFPVEQ